MVKSNPEGAQTDDNQEITNSSKWGPKGRSPGHRRVKGQHKQGEGGSRREEGHVGGWVAPAAAVGHTPSYLDELLKLLDVGLQLGLLDTQFLPAQFQGLHSALKYLGVGEQRGQEGPWHGY